jgi:hypothetical protein
MVAKRGRAVKPGLFYWFMDKPDYIDYLCAYLLPRPEHSFYKPSAPVNILANKELAVEMPG